MELTIQHDLNNKRFYVEIDGHLALMDYSVSADNKTLDYKHTFVPEELRGQQIAEKIVLYALNYAKNNHYQVIPSCPYVKLMIERHPEYKEIAVGM